MADQMSEPWTLVDEPVIHSMITDCLPEGHRWQWEQVECLECGMLVHAGNNECMTDWVECGPVARCAKCWCRWWQQNGWLLTDAERGD